MKIALCSDSIFPRKDGVAVTVERYRRGLEELGHTVMVCGPAGAYGRTIGHVADRYPVFAPSHPRLRRAFGDVDIVHVFTAAGVGLAGRRIALSQRIPVVVSYLTDLVHYWSSHRAVRTAAYIAGLPGASQYFGIKRCRYRQPEQLVTAFLDGARVVLAPTNVVASGLGALTATTVLVLPLMSELAPEGDSARLHKQNGRDHTFLYLGRLSREKSIDWLLEVFARIVIAQPRSRLLVGGDGHMRSELEKYASRLGVTNHVDWLGPIPRHRVLDTMAGASAFLHPSLTDTQAIVLAEAASVGTPLVVRDTRLTWLREYGFAVTFAQDADDYAAAALRIASDDYLRQRSHSINLAASRSLAEAASMERLEAIYEEL